MPYYHYPMNGMGYHQVAGLCDTWQNREVGVNPTQSRYCNWRATQQAQNEHRPLFFIEEWEGVWEAL